MADRVRLEIDINDQSGAAGDASGSRAAAEAAGELLGAARAHREAARQWTDRQSEDWRNAGWAGPRVNAGGAAAETRKERRAREDDPTDPANLPLPGSQGRKNPFDLGKTGMDGLDRLLYQNSMGSLGNAAAAFSKYNEASATGSGVGMAGLNVVSAVGKIVGEVGDAIGSAAVKAGQLAQSIIGNDYAQTVKTVMDGMTDLARKIPVVGEAFAGYLRAIAGPAEALIGVLKSLAGRGKELAAYDPRIAQAEAMAEIQTLFADIREAQQMGGEYAELIRLENEFSIMWREAIMPIKKAVAEWMVDHAEDIKGLLRAIAGALKIGWDATAAAGDALYSTLNTFTGGALSTWEEVKKQLGMIANNTRKADENIDPTRQLYEVLGSGRNSDIRQQADLGQVGAAVPMGQGVVEPNFGG